MTIPKPRAVIFDWDDTIIDSWGPSLKSLNKALVAMGQPAWSDDEGFITEGSSTNAWIVDKNGTLITRPTENHAILKGVTRNSIQALCKKEGIKLVERPFTVAEAYKAKEAFITAAGALVMPIVEIDGHKIGDGKLGALTSKLLDLYVAYAADPKKKQEHWTAK